MSAFGPGLFVTGANWILRIIRRHVSLKHIKKHSRGGGRIPGTSSSLPVAHVLLLDDFIDVVGHVGEVRFDLKVHTAGLKRNKTHTVNGQTVQVSAENVGRAGKGTLPESLGPGWRETEQGRSVGI